MIAIIAPARLASTRFPEKLLHVIKGKPLILWVAERLRVQVPEIPLYFAVDSDRLAGVLDNEGFHTVMTREDHASGTDRLAEANEKIGADVIINVQADEPMVSANQVRKLTEMIESGASMATLATGFEKRDDFLDPNQVKVVIDKDGKALYFSRSPIPHNRDGFDSFGDAWVAQNSIYRHLGIYAYRAEFLNTFCSLPPSRLESIEKLEQLRALENGYSIQVGITNESSIGIDTPADAERFEALLSQG